MTDVDDLLRQLAATTPRPTPRTRDRAADRLRTAIADPRTAQAKNDAGLVRPRRSRRWTIVPAIVALTAVAAGAAAAAGLFNREARQAFTPGSGCPSHVSTPKRAVQTVLPDGNTLELWTAVKRSDGHVEGFCVARIGDHGKQIFPGKPNIPGSGWIGAAGIGVRGDRPTGWVDASGAEAWADATGKMYSVDYGVAGDATTIEFHLAHNRVLKASVGDGWYLIVMPYNNLVPGFTIVARDKTGNVIGQAKKTCYPPYVAGSNRRGYFGIEC